MTRPRPAHDLSDRLLVEQLIRRVAYAGRDDWRVEELEWELLARLEAVALLRRAFQEEAARARTEFAELAGELREARRRTDELAEVATRTDELAEVASRLIDSRDQHRRPLTLVTGGDDPGRK
jgi:hypothetical protein